MGANLDPHRTPTGMFRSLIVAQGVSVLVGVLNSRGYGIAGRYLKCDYDMFDTTPTPTFKSCLRVQ